MAAGAGRRWRIVAACSLTAGASVCALLAIWFALTTGERAAAWFLVGAGLLDAVDGVVARRLGATSAFGAALDALSDLLAFGVAPAVAMAALGLVHPLVAGAYVLAIQLRLARFQASPQDESRYYHGISSPDAAYVGLLAGMLPGVGYSAGFAVAGALALAPFRLGPKGWRVVRALVGAAAVALFVHVAP